MDSEKRSPIRKICCIGAGYVGGPTCSGSIVVEHEFHWILFKLYIFIDFFNSYGLYVSRYSSNGSRYECWKNQTVEFRTSPNLWSELSVVSFMNFYNLPKRKKTRNQ